MATLMILMIGHDGALKSPRAQEIKNQLSKTAKVFCASVPDDLSKIGALRQEFDHWIFVASGVNVPNYASWKQHLSKLKVAKPEISIVSDLNLASHLSASFKFTHQLIGKAPSSTYCVKFLGEKSVPVQTQRPSPSNLANRAMTQSHTKMESDSLADPILDPIEDALVNPSPESSLAPPSSHLDEIVASLDQEVSKHQIQSLSSQSENLDNLLAEIPEAKNEKVQTSEETAEFASLMAIDEESISQEAVQTKIQIQNVNQEDVRTQLISAMPVNVMSEFVETNSEGNIKAVTEASQSVYTSKSKSFAPTEEVETLQRYAALKEREARERDATIQVLSKQVAQVQEKMARSEIERRRLLVEIDDAQVNVRALEEQRDQHQNQMRKLEAQLHERQKAIQSKLDNAQFSATRAEKKLEEFRDRVRNDILRIRLRERELSNKLELQKRDAEALLSSKDERLLEQKREIDRMEYEMDLFKERMIDDTARAEERAAKLSRALQSLKMAQGVLTGIEEEVIPTSASMKDDSDNEAA